MINSNGKIVIKVKTILKVINIFILVYYTTGLILIDNINLSFIKSGGKFLVYIAGGLSLLYFFKRLCYKNNNIIYKSGEILIFSILVLIISFINSKSIRSISESIILIATALYAIYLVDYYSKKELFNLIFISQLIISIFSLIFTVFFPEYGKMVYEGELVWRGAFLHKNLFAANMAFGILVSNTCLNKNKNWNKIVYLNIILSSIMLLLSKSTTSIMIVLVSFVIYKMYSRMKIKFNPVYITIIFYLFTVYIISNDKKYNQIFLKIFNKDLSFTGRTPIWEVVIDIIKENPLWGYGYNNIWYEQSPIAIYIRKKVLFTVTGSHNGFLEWLLMIGGIGTLVLIALIIISGYRLIKISLYDKLVFKFSIQYLMYILIFYLTERSTDPLGYQVLMLFIVIVSIKESYKKYIINKNKGSLNND